MSGTVTVTEPSIFLITTAALRIASKSSIVSAIAAHRSLFSFFSQPLWMTSLMRITMSAAVTVISKVAFPALMMIVIEIVFKHTGPSTLTIQMLPCVQVKGQTGGGG